MSKHIGFRAAAIVLAVGMMLVQGCLTSPGPGATPAISLKAIGGSQNALAGTNLTFVMEVKNSQKSSDVVILTVDLQPAGWTTSLTCSTVELASGAARGFMLLVSIPAGELPGGHGIRVKATSTIKLGFAASKTVTVNVRKPSPEPLDLVRTGSTISVDYVGYLVDGDIFDTSLRGVGSDQAIQKSSSFNAPADNVYKPLVFTTGQNQMIAGFDRGVIGMGLDQWKTVRVPPADGYGKLETLRINLTESFPMHRVMPILNFTLTYGEDPAPNKVVVEPWWGWNVQVTDVQGDNVSLLTLPAINASVFPYGWETKVIDVNGSADGGMGRITVRHYPTSAVNVTYQRLAATITDLTPDHVDITYNDVTGNPLALVDLYFSIRIVHIA